MMEDLVIAGCTISNAIQPARVILGQKADQSKKTVYPTNGRKETTSETSNEKVNDRVAEL